MHAEVQNLKDKDSWMKNVCVCTSQIISSFKLDFILSAITMFIIIMKVNIMMMVYSGTPLQRTPLQ